MCGFRRASPRWCVTRFGVNNFLTKPCTRSLAISYALCSAKWRKHCLTSLPSCQTFNKCSTTSLRSLAHRRASIQRCSCSLLERDELKLLLFLTGYICHNSISLCLVQCNKFFASRARGQHVKHIFLPKILATKSDFHILLYISSNNVIWSIKYFLSSVMQLTWCKENEPYRPLRLILVFDE